MYALVNGIGVGDTSLRVYQYNIVVVVLINSIISNQRDRDKKSPDDTRDDD